MDEVFSAERIVDGMLRFERGLALGLAEVGIAPRPEAEAIAVACETPVDDPGAVLATTWENGTPLIALVELVKSRLESDEERRWVHHGATTQDVVDSAYMVLSRRALDLLDQGLVNVAMRMKELVEAYRDQPHMARTFLQDAQPTTFGLRVAGWLEPLLSQIETLRGLRSTLALQLGGPVGNLSSYGADGMAVVQAVAAQLELAAPAAPWHTDRSRIRSLADAVVGPVDTLAKVAMDVSLLTSSTIGEVTARHGGSSSMPDKQNPVDSIRVLAGADLCRGAVAMVVHARPHELDRALGAWHMEWVALPLIFQSASAVIEAAGTLLATLEIDRAAMSARAGDTTPAYDPALIDSVLGHHERVMGGA
jgi:3-carboxy-cis,cis-muconate cycloisomerase